MAKGDLKPLIRLSRHALEELQKALGEMHAEADRLKARREQLEQKLAEEAAIAGQDAVSAAQYPGYLKRVRKDQQQIDDLARQVDARIARQLDRIADAFGELKKLELAQNRRDAEHRQHLNKLEADELDEIALDRHLRANRK